MPAPALTSKGAFSSQKYWGLSREKEADTALLIQSGVYCYLKKSLDYTELEFATRAAQNLANGQRTVLGKVCEAIDEWARTHEAPDKSCVTIGNRTYTPMEITREVRRLSADGTIYLKSLLSYTADLIAQRKTPLDVVEDK